MKAQFPFFEYNPEVVYLDSAATTQKLGEAIRMQAEFESTKNASTHRGMYPLSEQATMQFEQTRKKIAQFLNADENEIVFTKNATEAVNVVALGLTKSNQDIKEIVVSEAEHHANLIPWQELAKEKQAKLKCISLGEDYQISIKDAQEKIGSSTSVLAITAASNVTGAITPLKDIVNYAREQNPEMVILVDATQVLAHRKLDVKELDVDALVCSAHKMYGPYGVGILYAKEQLLKNIPPALVGGGAIHSVSLTNTTFALPPQKFEPGTQNVSGVIAFGKTIDWLEANNTKNQEQELRTYLLQKLQEIDAQLFHPKPNVDALPIVSISLPGKHPHDVASHLAEKNICVRAGHHCCMPLMEQLGVPQGTLRISLGAYSTQQDIDALITALKEFQTNATQPLVEDEVYRHQIMELYKSPENYGALQNATHHAHRKNPLCGDEILMQIQVREESVTDIKFSGHGCAICMASASLITEQVKGKTLPQVQALKSEDALRNLQIPISAVRTKCAVLPLETLQEALA